MVRSSARPGRRPLNGSGHSRSELREEAPASADASAQIASRTAGLNVLVEGKKPLELPSGPGGAGEDEGGGRIQRAT